MAIGSYIPAVRFDALTAFGLIAVTLMLLCYALEGRSPAYVLGFAMACVLGSVYGFLQGAWPFGLVEGVWSVVALRRWWGEPRRRRSAGTAGRADPPDPAGPPGDGPWRPPQPKAPRPPAPAAAEPWVTERI